MTSFERNWRTMTSCTVAVVMLLLTIAQTTTQCSDDVTKPNTEETSSTISSPKAATAESKENRRLEPVIFSLGSSKAARVERSAAGSDEVSEAPDDRDKRKWEKNTVRVWGKRDQLDDDDEVEDDIAAADKRQWSPRNKVRVWGKRSGAGQRAAAAAIEADETAADVDMEEKRKWADNRVKVWGKRSDASARPVVDRVRKPAAGRQNLKTGNGADINMDEIIKQRVSVVKRAIDDSMAAAAARSGGGRYLWVPDDEEETIDAAARSAAEKRAAAAAGYGTPGAARGGAQMYWRADGGGPKRSWRTNVIRVWG